VPVIGYGCDSFPLFYHRQSLHTLADRADDPLTVAAVAATHWGFARTTGVVVAQPVAAEVALEPDDVEPVIAEALDEAQELGINGHDLTPFVLARVNEATDGRTLAANRRLVQDNAGLAAEIAVAYYSD